MAELTGEDRIKLQCLMETDPDAAFAFHAKKLAEAEHATKSPAVRAPILLSGVSGAGKPGAIADAAKELGIRVEADLLARIGDSMDATILIDDVETLRREFLEELRLSDVLEKLLTPGPNEDGPQLMKIFGGDGTLNRLHVASDLHYGMLDSGDALEGEKPAPLVLVRHGSSEGRCDPLTFMPLLDRSGSEFAHELIASMRHERRQPPNFGKLETFVRSEAYRADRAEMMLDLIRPLYARMGADGSYRLSRASHDCEVAALAVLREFSDEPVERVILVSDEDLVRRQPWMTDKEHLASALDALASVCGASFGEGAFDITIGRVVDETGRLTTIHTQVDVDESLGSFLDGPMSDCAVASLLKQAITLAAHCAITDDDLNDGRCIRLLRLLDGFMPFGTRESEPGTWFVRVGK